jgi:hypothetical protein
MKTILTISLALTVSAGLAQTKPDTVRYMLTEPQVLAISQLLAAGDECASASDKVSTNQWKAYHAAVLQIDSVLRRQYMVKHPVKETIKKP